MRPAAHSKGHRSFAVPVIAVASALTIAACSSSNKTSTSSAARSATTVAAPSTTAGGSSMSEASVTLTVSNIPGVGDVLVNGDGRTLYILVGEKGGKVTCTSAGGCTTVWPAVVLPAGMAHGVAGSGVQASLLGTVTGPSGDVRLTYAGWPLYTFAPDTGAGQAKGQGVKDAFGLWWVLSPSGNPITTTAAASSSQGAPSPTSPPATSPPATEPPATEPPATSPPATSPPSTSPPTTAPSSGGAGF